MTAAELTQEITIEQNTPARAAGTVTDSWSALCTRRAKIAPAAGGEKRVGTQTVADVTHRVTVRSDTLTRQITPQMRVVWGTRTLHIVRCYDPDNRRRWIEIEAVERL